MPRSQIRLTDGCEYGGAHIHIHAHIHTRTHTSPHLSPASSWAHALDMRAALGLTYDATWEICLCFPFTFCLLICLFVCRVCLLISQLGVRLSDSTRMVNRRNSPAWAGVGVGAGVGALKHLVTWYVKHCGCLFIYFFHYMCNKVLHSLWACLTH